MARQPIGGAPDVRRNNLAVVLALLHQAGSMRRAELTDRTGLNRSTVAGLVAELEALGLVSQLQASGMVNGMVKVGRPSPVVQPRPESLQVIAADVGVRRVVMALIGLGGQTLVRTRRSLSSPNPRRVVSLLSTMAGELLASEPARQVIGMGVSLPGVVRGGDGNVRFAPNLGWRDAPLGEMLAERLPGLPVTIGNDSDLGVLAEHSRGVARGCDDVVFVEGDAGVGCGMVIGGRPLVGAGGYAGELGHMTVRATDGRRCRCGARGCWETEISAEAVARALGLPATIRDDELVAELRLGGDRRVRALGQVAFYLGTGLATVVNLLNPRMIVLGGLLRELYPLVCDDVAAALAASALTAPAEQVLLRLPALGADAVLLGAAEAAWQDVLSDPVAVLAS